MAKLSVQTVANSADRKAFIDFPYSLYANDPNWIPPLKSEVKGLLSLKSNPWFEHARLELFLARRNGQITGRISAQVDDLVGEQMGAGTGQWGMFEAADEETALALIETAENWLRSQNMTRALGPFSLSIWDEPGLLVEGHDHPPTVMMGHNNPIYESWIENAGYAGVKDLYTYDLDITRSFPPIVQRIVASGERNARIRIRPVNKSRFDEEAALILAILNDAWAGNWGFTPLTDAEIAHVGKKLKPIVFEDLIRIAEVDGEPVAFMMTLPNLNELTADLNGNLLPFGWAKLLWRLRHPRVNTMRVPLMGVLQRLQSSRLASQLAFMMIEYIRRDALVNYSATRGEIGWILDDNQGMRSIAEAINSKRNKTYRIYEKQLSSL